MTDTGASTCGAYALVLCRAQRTMLNPVNAMAVVRSSASSYRHSETVSLIETSLDDGARTAELLSW